MKKIILLSLITVAFAANAQIGTSTQVGGENSKWTVGGSAGLGGSFGGNGDGTSVYLSPRVGYKVTENFEAGLAGSFNWSNSNIIPPLQLGSALSRIIISHGTSM